jgi:hypothetical protein
LLIFDSRFLNANNFHPQISWPTKNNPTNFQSASYGVLLPSLGMPKEALKHQGAFLHFLSKSKLLKARL